MSEGRRVQCGCVDRESDTMEGTPVAAADAKAVWREGAKRAAEGKREEDATAGGEQVDSVEGLEGVDEVANVEGADRLEGLQEGGCGAASNVARVAKPVYDGDSWSK